MEQAKNSSIEVQIGKIILNALVQNQVVYLPQVGSLSVDRVSAKLKGSKKILPPRHIVKYSSQMEGISVIDIIEREGGCSQDIAESIYDRWYNGAKCDDGVEIIGVGKVVNQRFNISSYLDNILNIELHKALHLRRRRASQLWIGVSIIGCVAVGLFANMLFNNIMRGKDSVAVQEIVPQQVVEVEQTQVPQVVEENIVEEVSTPPQPNIPIIANPRYRVVYGVFSIMENALKAERIAHNNISDIKTEIRPYGKMFMVSLYASDNISECQSFVDKHKDIFTDMWIYKRRN